MEQSTFLISVGLVVMIALVWGARRLQQHLERAGRQSGWLSGFGRPATACVHQEVSIPERFFIREDTIELQVPGEPATFLVQLRPYMRGKVIRLRNAVQGRSAHLLLRILATESAPGQDVPYQEVATYTESDAEYQRMLSHLRVIVLGDMQQAERLIEAEQMRLPHLDRSAWVRAAIERWQRDNR